MSFVIQPSGGGITNPYANPLSLTNSTASTNTTTGALLVTGGVGIVGNLNVGGNIGNTSVATTIQGSSLVLNTVAAGSISIGNSNASSINLFTQYGGTISLGNANTASINLNPQAGGSISLGNTNAANIYLSPQISGGSLFLGISGANTSTTYLYGQVINIGNGNTATITTNKPLTTNGQKSALVTKSANYTTTATDEFILVDATSAARTITLLAPSTAGAGAKITVIKTDSSINAVTVTAVTSGGTLATQYASGNFVSDSTNWYRY